MDSCMQQGVTRICAFQESLEEVTTADSPGMAQRTVGNDISLDYELFGDMPDDL